MSRKADALKCKAKSLATAHFDKIAVQQESEKCAVKTKTNRCDRHVVNIGIDKDKTSEHLKLLQN